MSNKKLSSMQRFAINNKDKIEKRYLELLQIENLLEENEELKSKIKQLNELFGSEDNYNLTGEEIEKFKTMSTKQKKLFLKNRGE